MRTGVFFYQMNFVLKNKDKNSISNNDIFMDKADFYGFLWEEGCF